MSLTEIPAILTVPELAELVGRDRNFTRRQLDAANVPLRTQGPRRPALVYLADLTERMPALVRSISERLHLQALHGDSARGARGASPMTESR